MAFFNSSLALADTVDFTSDIVLDQAKGDKTASKSLNFLLENEDQTGIIVDLRCKLFYETAEEATENKIITIKSTKSSSTKWKVESINQKPMGSMVQIQLVKTDQEISKQIQLTCMSLRKDQEGFQKTEMKIDYMKKALRTVGIDLNLEEQKAEIVKDSILKPKITDEALGAK